jgi:hypothetical protein
MPTSHRWLTAGVATLLVVALGACSGSLHSGTDAPTATPDPAQARAAYSAAICPIFDRISLTDQPLEQLRDLGRDDGDVEGARDDISALVDELGTILTDLENVPTWQPGSEFRFLLITALHDIRVRLLNVADDPTARDAADALAATPYLSSDAMDRAMDQALQAGFVCLPAE